MFKKSISLGLAAIMTFSLGTTAFASENSSDNYTIRENGVNSIIVESNNSTEVITVTDGIKNTTVSMINSETGNTEYLVRDKVSNTLYSSITGETIRLENVVKTPSILRKSVTEHNTYRLSYSEIRSVLGDNASVSGLASLVLSLVPGVNGLAAIVGTISTIVGGVATIFIPNNSKSGFGISYKVKKYYRGPYGKQHVYKRVYTILDIEKY